MYKNETKLIFIRTFITVLSYKKSSNVVASSQFHLSVKKTYLDSCRLKFVHQYLTFHLGYPDFPLQRHYTASDDEQLKKASTYHRI